eukprot:15362919-Ditylum_brightwellii.AAC.1
MYNPSVWSDAYIDTSQDTLYAQVDNGYFVQYIRSSGYMSTYEPTESSVTELPNTAVFTPIRKSNGKIICTQLIDLLVLDAQQQSIDLNLFRAYLESLDPRIQQLLGNLRDKDVDVKFWITALQSGIVVTASDGSVKDGQGTYAVIFMAGDKELRFQGPVDCHPLLLQSYRAELTGLLAIWVLLECLSNYRREDISGKVLAYVNNVSAMNANNQEGAFPGEAAHTAPDFDLLQEIWSYRLFT